MAAGATAAPGTGGGSLNFILIARRDGEPDRYVGSERGDLIEDLGRAVLYQSEAAAMRQLRRLVTRDLERKQDVTLDIGHVAFTLVTTSGVKKKPMAAGFVIKRENGEYYRGPKTRNANSFQEAHYGFVPNRDSATVFNSESAAQERARGILQVLQQTAESMKGPNNRVYADIAARSACQVIAV